MTSTSRAHGEGKQRSVAPQTEATDIAETERGFLVRPESAYEPTISVVMPTMNEEGGIDECITRIQNALEELEVPGEIIVSDSSIDDTPAIAEKMGAKVVSPDEPGYGYAYQYAFEHVRGDYVVIGDADTTYDFEELPKLIKRMHETDADMVMGSRLEGEIKAGAMPALHKYVGNPLLTKFLNGFYDAGVSDAHSGFRVITLDALEALDLETHGMEFASEMIMEAGARDYTIEEVPIVYHEREGEAKLESFRDGWRHVRFMLQNAPGYLFSVPGFLMVAFGVFVMALGGFDIPMGGVTVGVHTMVAGSLLTIVGYQVACLGVFATVASDPIRTPTDPVTTRLTERVRLKHGATVGLALVLAGGGYAAFLLVRWVSSGFTELPLIMEDIIAFTAIVVGVQTVFSSFFLSVLAE